MELNEIMKIEVSAISRTICEYSTDNYITSYAKQLTEMHSPEDNELIRLLTKRLIHWYEEEMPLIKEGKYIHSKEAHIKSFELLQEIQRQL